ncbi:MAG: hypothetical protein ABIG84_02140 [archaeon]
MIGDGWRRKASLHESLQIRPATAMLPDQLHAVDNSYLLLIIARPTDRGRVSMNPYVFDEAYILQNGMDPEYPIIIDQTDSAGIKLREKKPVGSEAYSPGETPVNAPDIPERDFFEFVSCYGAPKEVVALIPQRRPSR